MSSSVALTVTIVASFFVARYLALPLDNRKDNSINSIGDDKQSTSPWRLGDDEGSKLVFNANVNSPSIWDDIISTRGNGGDPVNYSGYKLLRAHPTMAQAPLVDSMGDNKNGVEVWNWRQDSNDTVILDVLSPPRELETVEKIFNETKLNYSEVIKDLQVYIDSETIKEEDCFFCNSDAKGAAHSMDWDMYHDIADMDGYMTYLEETYGTRVKNIEIGKSWENRTMRVMRISSEEFDPSKPAIWLDGGMHGREWVAPATATFLMRQLVEMVPDAKATQLFNWYILPVANPDGYEYSRHHDRLWRKTRSLHSESKAIGCVGVDANRNFGHLWNKDGSSDSPCSEVYAGPNSFSEPETMAIRDFLQEMKNEVKMYLTLHAYSQMVLFPWTHNDTQKRNYTELDELATVITDTINKQPSSSKYTHGRVDDLLYKSYGTSDDYAMGSLGIPYAFSLELRDLGKYGFILPPGEIESTATETYRGLVAMVEKLYEKLNITSTVGSQSSVTKGPQ